MKYYINVKNNRVYQYSLDRVVFTEDLPQYEIETDIELNDLNLYDFIDGQLVFNKEYDLLDRQEDIRVERQNQCFPIINRGTLWYEMLTDVQKQELKVWYQAWLDAPATLVIPNKPEWIQDL